MALFLVVITLLIGLVGIHAILSNQIFTESIRELDAYEDIVDARAEAISYATRAETHLFLYLTLGDETDKGNFFSKHLALEEQITILEGSVKTLAGIERISSLKSCSSEILSYGSQLVDIFEQNPDEFIFENHRGLINAFHEACSGARSCGVELVHMETTLFQHRIELLELSGNALLRGIVASLIVLLVTVPCVGIVVTRSITVPLQKLKSTAVALGNGALGIQSDLKLKDEIGDLVVSFNKMSSDLQRNQRLLLEAERFSAIETATWVGHDLRNPLQAIQNSKYLIAQNVSKLPSSSDVRKNVEPLIERIDASIQYSEGIIRNLKDFGSKEEPKQTVVDVNALLKWTLSKVIFPKGVEVVEELTAGLKIAVDEEMMGRVFMNLITNAVQAMEDGGRLKVSTKKADGFVEVSFQDTGNGMTEELVEKIFEPFFTTKAKGMGIGLSICKKFVEANGGSISVESQEGKGSTFTVKLPIAPDN